MTQELVNRNVFILGAGFSANAGAPLVRDFLDQSRDLYQDPSSDLDSTDRKHFEAVFEFKRRMSQCREKIEMDLDNIEQLFGLIDISERLGSSENTRNSIVYLIAKTIQSAVAKSKRETLIGFTPTNVSIAQSLPKNWLNSGMYSGQYAANLYSIFAGLLAGILDDPSNRSARRNAVISFNYDLVLDCALREIEVEPSYYLDPEPENSPTTVSLLKLHGSLNWAVCQKCKKVTAIPAEPNLGPATILSQSCSICSKSCQPLLVPPSWDKSEYREIMRPVWKRAVEELNRASRICVVGYSMPETDAFFKYLLTLGLAENHHLSKFIVVDMGDAVDEKYNQFLARLFHKRRYFFSGAGFEQFVTSNITYTQLGRGELLGGSQISPYGRVKT